MYTTKPVEHDTFLTSKYNGLVHVIRPPHHTITYSTKTSQIIGLNTNLSYYISFIDPTFSFLSINPETMPRALFNLKPNAGQFIMYVKVSDLKGEDKAHTSHRFCIALTSTEERVHARRRKTTSTQIVLTEKSPPLWDVKHSPPVSQT